MCDEATHLMFIINKYDVHVITHLPNVQTVKCVKRSGEYYKHIQGMIM